MNCMKTANTVARISFTSLNIHRFFIILDLRFMLGFGIVLLFVGIVVMIVGMSLTFSRKS
jgi:hypothetical protein